MGGGTKGSAPCLHKFDNLADRDFSEQSFLGANFAFAELSRTKFILANVKDASFMFATLWQTDFTNAELISANLRLADGWETIFTGARLIEANMEGFHGRGCNFRGANLVGLCLLVLSFGKLISEGRILRTQTSKTRTCSMHYLMNTLSFPTKPFLMVYLSNNLLGWKKLPDSE
jgi:hypothetical protein